MPVCQSMLVHAYRTLLIQVGSMHRRRFTSLMIGCWAVQVPFFPPVQKLEDVTPAAASALVRAAMGPDAASVEVRVQSVRQWTMSAQVADRFMVSSRNSLQLLCQTGMRWPVLYHPAALHGSCRSYLVLTSHASKSS